MIKAKKDEWKRIAALSNRIDRKIRKQFALPATNPSPSRNDYIAGAVVADQVNGIIGEEDEYP